MFALGPQNGGLAATSFSTRNLSGKGLHGGKGTVDLILLKHQILNKALGSWLEESPLTNRDKDIIKEGLGSHAKYLEKFQPGKHDVDLSWQSSLPMEARSYMRTVEGMVYTSNKDSKLKACLLNGASASDIPDSAEFKHEFEEIAKNWKSLRGGSLSGNQGDSQPDADMSQSQEDEVIGDVAGSAQFHCLSIDADPDFTAKQQAQLASLRQTLASLTEEEKAIVKKHEIEAQQDKTIACSALLDK